MHFRLFCFFGAASVASAQLPSLSLDDAIRLAWANDPAVAALALTPELAKAREAQAGIRPNPEVEFTAASLTPLRNESEWALGVGVSQRLPRRERIEQARAVARLGGESAALHLREQRRRIAGEVRRIYYHTVVQHTRRDLARRTLATQRELAATLERRRAAGEVAAADIDLLAFEITRAEQALAFAEAELVASTQRLRGRLRLAADSPLVLDTTLETLLARPLFSAPVSLETVRPTLALATLAIRQAEAAVVLAKSESRPDWTVGGGLEFERRTNDYTGRLENDPRLSVRASVPWPRRVSNRGDILEKQAALRIAEAELAAAQNELSAEIDSAVAVVRALQPVLLAHQTSLAPGGAIPETLRAAYERGEVTALQLAQARQQRFALETDFLHAAALYASALAEAETAAGLVPSQL
jgi:cobalt-zinc-cadmium efflux system outer membrane protein